MIILFGIKKKFLKYNNYGIIKIPLQGIRRCFIMELTAGLVFIEGVLSFLSPCFLPLIPIYVGYLSGEAGDRNKKWNVLKNSIGFIIGFTLVFILLGAIASGIGRYLIMHKRLLNKVFGVIIIIMGINYMGILKIPFLNMDKRFSYEGKKTNFIGAVFLGAAISFGWSPCIGSMLSQVLVLAASMNSIGKGIYLLFIYSMGMAIPFLITALLIQGASMKIRKILKYSRVLKIITGIILISTGILMYTGYFERLSVLLWR
ncbi:MAG: cytochrome c biosis protein CcdA [Clostridiales bacterium]|nr:cytochrome c biosis protein CcdA [Clostridiales bacterium]